MGAEEKRKDECSCEKISMVLPPPVTVPHDFPLPSSTRASLKKLLTALGISSELMQNLDDAGEHESLRSFLVNAAEHVRWNEATDHTATQRIYHAKTVFRMSRQVIVKIGGTAEKLPSPEQADLIERLAGVLDRVPSVDVRDQTIMIGGEGIDAFGRLWLLPSQSSAEWQRVISMIDLGQMRQRQAFAEQLKLQEKSVAQHMGIGMIYTSADVRSQPGYAQFLKIMTEMTGAVTSTKTDIALCIVPQQPGITDEEISIDPELGFIRIPMMTSPAKIYRFLQDHQNQAFEIRKRHEKREALLEELSQTVRRRLRLRKLHRDPEISSAQFQSACHRLLKNASTFGDWTEDAMKTKTPSIWEKLKDAESVEWTQEEVKTAIHWFRQLVAFLCGVLWGLIPFTGLYGFLTHLVLNTIGTIVFYSTVMKVEPEDFGGHGALTQEALPPSISMFLLMWIMIYSFVHF